MATREMTLREGYLRGFDKEAGAPRKVGFELEYPMVYGVGHPKVGETITSHDVSRLFKTLARVDPRYEGIDDGYALQRHFNGFDMFVGTDCGAGQLETGLPPAHSLREAAGNVREVLGPLVEVAQDLGIYVLGYGMQPFSPGVKANVMPKTRYGALETWLGDSLYQHTLSAANQIHVEVDGRDVLDVVNVLNIFSPAIIAVSANSSVAFGADTGFADYRGTIWNRTTFSMYPERNSGRTGVVQFASVDEFLHRLMEYSPILTKRDGKYITYLNVPSLRSFIEQGEADAMDLGTGMRMKIEPEMVDMHFMEGTVWWEARPKSIFGTVESRCAALQPSVTEITAVGALIFGLAMNSQGALLLSRELGMDADSANRARNDAVRNGLDANMEYPMKEVVGQMLEVAKAGLRGIGEDTTHLDPLYERVESGITPAQRSTEVLKKEGREGFIQYARLRFD